MVDPDYNASVPTNVVLHTIVSNLTNNEAPDGTLTLASIAPALAAYVGPEPQAGEASHNFTLLLFQQPGSFSVPLAFESFLPLNLSNVYTRVTFPQVDFL
ncbi:MAG: hypothetical protein M1818_008065 [Claussenomyces sp. TS43310]|nr:MAG: hypothetical protein M1818_008065 [Claussenomyces sp. TS43310]